MASDQSNEQPVGGNEVWKPRRRGRVATAISSRRRGSGCRWSRFLTPGVEGLEDRTLLAVITWSTTAAPNGGDWNAAGNWVGNKVPGPTDTAVIKGFSGVQTVFIDSPSTDDSVISVTTDNTVHLQVESGSLTLSVGSPTTFGGPVEVDTNGTLNINPGAQVTINDEQTLTDNGQVNVTSATVAINKLSSYEVTYGITVGTGGTLTATNASITHNGTAVENTEVQVDAGGHLEASGTTFSIDNVAQDADSTLAAGDLTTNVFNTTVTVPVTDVSLLTNNLSFAAVNLTGGLTSKQSVTLNPLGTGTTVGQYYSIPSSLSVASTATLTIGTGATLYIPDQQTLADSGQLNVNGATVIFDKLASYEVAYGISVTAGATMAATNSTFSKNGTAVEDTEITVAAGGHLTATGSNFAIDNVSLAAGSTLDTGDLTGDIFSTTLTLPVSDVPLLTNNLTFNAVNITGGVTGTTPVALDPLGTQTTVGQYYSIPSGLSVASGATLTIGTGATLYIPDQQTLAVSGTLNVTGATVIIDKLASYEVAYGISVGAGATMAVTDSTFSRNGNAVENAEITVAAGGHLTAAGSSFSLDNVSLATGSTLAAGDFTGDIFSTTLTLPVADVPVLTNNLSFNAVNITGSVTGSPPVTLNPLGTQTTVGQYYSIPSGLSVASGATLTIGTGATLYIPDQQTLAVSGTLNVTGATVIIDKLASYEVAYGISVGPARRWP